LLLPVDSEILSSSGCRLQRLEHGYRVTQTEDSMDLAIRTIQNPEKVAIDDGYVCDYGVLRLCKHDAPSAFTVEYEGEVWKAIPQMWLVDKETGLNTSVRIYFE